DAGYELQDLIAVPAPQPTEPDTTGESSLPSLPEKFWTARPHLSHIRRAAHAYGGCADLVLFATLARLSAMVSPKLTIDSGITTGSLNLFAAVVGPLSIGKST